MRSSIVGVVLVLGTLLPPPTQALFEQDSGFPECISEWDPFCPTGGGDPTSIPQPEPCDPFDFPCGPAEETPTVCEGCEFLPSNPEGTAWAWNCVRDPTFGGAEYSDCRATSEGCTGTITCSD